MARQRRLEGVFAATDEVPATRSVPDLEAALGLVRRLGGSIASETRTAPGIGSWAFVARNDGSELLLWQSSISAGRNAHPGPQPRRPNAVSYTSRGSPQPGAGVVTGA